MVVPRWPCASVWDTEPLLEPRVRLDARQSCYARALQFDGMLVTYVTPERRAARIAHLFEDFRETGNVVWLVGRKERD